MPVERAIPKRFPPLHLALKTIAEFSDAQVAELRKLVVSTTAREANLSDPPHLPSAPHLNPARVRILIESVSLLYTVAHEMGSSSSDDFRDTLEEYLSSLFLSEYLGDDLDSSLDKLCLLVAKNPHIDADKKRFWLRRGIFPNAIAFSSFVDLRPSISADRTKIDGLVPVAFFSVDTDEEHKESFIVQLDAGGLQGLRKSVDDLVKKFDAVRSDDRLRTLLMTDED